MPQVNTDTPSLFRALKGRGKPHDFMAICPAHRDRNPSLHVTTTKDGATLVHCFAGCTQDAVIDALRNKGLWSERQPRSSGPRAEARTGQVVASYDYITADGELAHQTLRLEPKSFRQRRPAPETGLWIWGLTTGEYMRMGPAKDWLPFKEARFAEWPTERERRTFDAASLVLYRLPDRLKAGSGVTVYLCEGEKDADNLVTLGFVATTNAMGAGKWKPQYNESLRGADVVLLPHNDATGRDHAENVAIELHGVAKRLRMLDIAKHWPECRAGQDISDWLAAGGTADKLKDLVETLPDWQPSGDNKPSAVPLTAAEFLSLELPPRKMIVSPWLPEKGTVMIYSPRGVGKTLLGMTSAYAIAAGAGFLGFQIEEPRKVFYIDGEMPAQTMQERLAAIIGAFSKEPPTNEHFRILLSDLAEFGLPDLGAPEGQAWIDARIGDADVIIADNISTLVRSGKENEAEGWLPMQSWALRHRRQGRAVILLHHAGKGGAQRGTSKREDVLDTVISLRHPTDYSPDQGARFEVHFEKCRGFYGNGAQPFEARYEVRSGAALWTRTEIVDAERARVVAAIKDGLSIREAADELGMHRSRVERLKRKAVELGELSATAASAAAE
jgi:AAA domain/Homeodomain-like domain